MYIAALDVDGTLTTTADSWRFLHEGLNTWSKARKHAQLFFSKAISYEEWARLDVGLWKNVSLNKLTELVHSISLRKGVEKLAELKNYGYKLVAITTSVSLIVERIAKRVGLDLFYANEVEVKNGLLTGEVKVGVEYGGKGEVLKKLKDGAELTVAVGDGPPDIGMFEVVDVGISFNPTDREVKSSSDITVRSESLEPIVKLLVGLALSFKRASTYRKLP